jgi:hypothetical protein
MTSRQSDLRGVVITALRIVTFRATREELVGLDNRHLLLGLLCTWLVGMGRYWNNPRAHSLQLLGVGSVVYVFLLAFILWALIYPLRPKDWSYRGVLTFVTLTSPPAIIYAIPVEMLSDLDTARTVKVSFLAVVATWRVALLAFYLVRLAQLSLFARIVATMLPLTLIVTTLTALNLERAVFDIMSGLHESGTANDAAYLVLNLLTVLSVLAFLPLLICYVILVCWKARTNRGAKIDAPKQI